MHRENAGQRIERPLVRDQRSVLGLPPVAVEKSGHHAVAASAVPHEHAARREHAREFGDDTSIVRRLREKTERCEQVEHRVESPGPACGQRPHVSARVAKARSRPTPPRERQQFRRIIEPVDVEPGLGEQMGVTALAARDIEYARARWKSEHVDQPRGFMSIALEREQRFVLEQVLVVEVRLPPLVPLLSCGQKKTGSR